MHVATIKDASMLYNLSTTLQNGWKHVVYMTYNKIVLTPLARLYLWGPHLNGWGFWAGKALHDICAQMTHMPSDFWIHHPDECMQVISKSFYSNIILIETCVYLYLIYKFISLVFRLIKKCC